ncbi:hypothetical protein SASPL_123917 [Salvia splendens]|uniref:Plastocyanin-like domain-containing protein n=1 Tax=Salvia splendens TaxID=180675 RepID=A0A8X8ZTG1_SALSN|nr:hypothetical protein SASPL_123917 [Salvia splendens]
MANSAVAVQLRLIYIKTQTVSANATTIRGYAAASSLIAALALLLALHAANADNPYRYYTWKITYGDIYPLGVKQQAHLSSSFSLCICVFLGFFLKFFWGECVLQGILINGQFPGPTIDCITNDNLIISVYNYLNAPFFLSW